MTVRGVLRDGALANDALSSLLRLQRDRPLAAVHERFCAAVAALAHSDVARGPEVVPTLTVVAAELCAPALCGLATGADAHFGQGGAAVFPGGHTAD